MEFQLPIGKPHEAVPAHICSFYFWPRCSYIRSRQSGNTRAHDDPRRIRKQNPDWFAARCPIPRPTRSDFHASDSRL